MKQKLTPEKAKSLGYRIISRKSPTIAARIDRTDWKEFMATKQPNGAAWVDCLGNDAGDHYRRCYSEDIITVPSSWIKKLGNSTHGPNKYMGAK